MNNQNLEMYYSEGSFGGVAYTVTGHPLEMQSERKQRSILNIIQSCYKYEGLTGFYKGMGFPLATVSLINAVVFSTNEFNRGYLIIFPNNSGCVTGGIAGMFCTVVATPVELVKTRLQVQRASKVNSYYTGIFDCLKKTYNYNGIRGIYKGNLITNLREIPAYAAQFGSYYYSKYLISTRLNIEQNDLPVWALLIAGGISGIFCWTFSYPQDFIKTNLQLDLDGSKFRNHKFIRDGGIIECTKFVLRNEGLRGFWVGFLPQTIHAIITNTALFYSYETIKSHLKSI